ncbi:MAG: tetratricopeptide repeat protein [Acidobacteria bacterium]|nr:tetratricopeptide repeat protein [Acidobacteriota bacterium]
MAISRDKVLREAEKLVQKGKLEAAIRQYEKLLKANPNDVTTINRIGDLYGKIGQVDRAVELYERIAEFFIQDGFSKKAIAVLKKINRMAPQRLDIFEKLAGLYLELSLTGEAKAQYQILADWYAKNGDRENALRIQRKMADVDPGNHVVQLRLADMLMEAGEHDEALEAFGQLLKVLLDRERVDEADKLARHVLELKPPRADFLVPVCNRLVEAGKRDRALELVNEGLVLSKDDQELKALKIRLTMKEGSAEGLDLEAAESLLHADPDNIEIRVIVGTKYLEAGEGEKARDVLAPLIEADLRRGEFRRVQQLTDKLRAALPRDLSVLLWSLRSNEATGRQEKMLEIKGALADLHYSEKRLDAAQALYMELADLDPENETFRKRLLELSSRGHGSVPAPAGLETGIPGEVVAAQPAGPSSFAPEDRLAEARVFAKYGLIEKAVRHLEYLVKSYPEQDDARRELVRLLCEDGLVERARELAGPLEEHFQATGDAEGLAWLRGLLAPPAASAPEAQVLEAASATVDGVAEEEEEVLFLDLDAEVGGPSEGIPVEHLAEEGKATAGPARLEVEAAPGQGGAGTGIEELDLSWVEEAVRKESGELPRPAPAAPARQEPPLLDFSEVAMEETGEPVELLDITGVVSGPPLSELERLDFFISEELFQDAARILDDLESRFPGDAELAARRLRLKEKGVILMDAGEAHEEPAEELFTEEELYVDLAGELEKELAEEEAMVEEATGHGKDEALLEEVFREFQRGVAEQLSEEDSDTHFNLGIAYKEMGLLAEAIGEFQIAAKDPRFHLEGCSMIAVCYLEQGLHDEAVRWYETALKDKHLSSDARIALLYDLGLALLAAGREDESFNALSEVAAADPTYRDVDAHLQSLQRQRHVN